MQIPTLIAAFTVSLQSALGISMGLSWGYINFLLIKELTISFLKKDKGLIKITMILLIKFPILYLTGYYLLLLHLFSPWFFLIGFTLALILCINLIIQISAGELKK